tara:strand:- start:54 stop:416 length:363 start_codon:yes stop_codon:yes gene_type:complete
MNQGTPFRKSNRPLNDKELTSGLPREIIEYLETNSDLAKSAIESNKSDFKNNILYIFIGFILSLIPLTINLIGEKQEKELLIKQFDEINASYRNLEKEQFRMRSINESLKIELKELNSEK